MIEWIFDQLRLLVSLGFILAGTGIFFESFKPGMKRAAGLLLALVIFSVGVYIFPQDKYEDEQDIYYRY